MRRWLRFAFLTTVVAAQCDAQVDILTLAESEEILERLPQFQASEARGECPGFDAVDSDAPRRFVIQVRAFCQPDGFTSGLIGRFEVDRSTGSVPVPREPADMRDLASSLVKHARSRALSEGEAECLARRAVSSAAPPGEELSVARRPGGADGQIHFAAKCRLTRLGPTAMWDVSVDTGAFAVLQGANGLRIHSPEVDGTASRMRAVRDPPSLSTIEAIEVAARVPSILAPLSAKCSLLSAEFVAVEDTCENYPRALRVLAAVDVLSGDVTDARTQRPLDTPQSAALAQELLRQASERQAMARAAVESACR
jgi:hypothetical protein